MRETSRASAASAERSSDERGAVGVGEGGRLKGRWGAVKAGEERDALAEGDLETARKAARYGMVSARASSERN